MKNYIKGIITGIIIGALICSLHAMAETIDALFNQVRININGIDEIQWDEDITLADGSKAPSSILYNGTTYLPMRKLGELSGNKIYWNGDSRTVSMTGKQKDIEVIAEKRDKNGNLWQYYTFEDTDNNSYLGVKDETRGYERVYRMPSTTVNVTEDAIFFARITPVFTFKMEYDTNIIKLDFLNDENSQDGEIIKYIGRTDGEGVIDGEHFFYALTIPGTGEHGELAMYNYATGEYSKKNYWIGRYTNITDVKIKSATVEKTVIEYVIHLYESDYTETVTFDKATNEFK